MNNKIIKKTYRKLDLIAKGGPDNILIYKKFIDDLIDNNEYDILYEVLLKYYHIDIQRLPDIDSVKNNTFDAIRLKTTSSELDRMKQLQNKLNVYIVGQEVFNLNNKYIGKIFMVEDITKVTTLQDTYTISGDTELEILTNSLNKIISDGN